MPIASRPIMKTRHVLAATTLAMALSSDAVHAQEVRTGFLDGTVTVDGHDYRYQVYVPSTYTEAERWPVILFLHGAGERGDDGLRPTIVGLGDAIRRDPARFPAIVVFPQAPEDSTWTGTPAEAAMAALDRTLEEYATDPGRVYVTGLSMGGHGAWYLAYHHPERFAAVAPVCGWVDHHPRFPTRNPVVRDDDEVFHALAQRLRDVPVWIVHGETDTVVPVEESRRAAAALEAVGAPVRFTELIGTDHNAWDPTYASPAFLEWLFAQRRGGQGDKVTR